MRAADIPDVGHAWIGLHPLKSEQGRGHALGKADVNVMRATKTCVTGERFQYDYLVDDIADDDTIDYTLTDKVPEALRQAIKSSKRRYWF